MKILENLEPKNVFGFFETICSIPHGSTNTKQISDYCVGFAKDRGLEYYQDGANNVIIIKEATAGYESAPPLILQGHLDMVCEKEPDCHIDFLTDGLTLTLDGDLIRAVGTTLGGDDGIAVAMTLAILDSSDIPHPRLEAVFTTDEEIGMDGAVALDVSPLKSKKLINLDSEDEGILTVSCAGGSMTQCTIPVTREKKTGCLCSVSVTGLMGGHSGVEIDKERGNSNVLMGRLLYRLGRSFPLCLKSLSGGQKDNAIPRETTAELIVAEEHLAALEAQISAYDGILKNEFKTSDPGASAIWRNNGEDGAEVLTADSAKKTVSFLMNAPNGIQAMSADIPGLVETSLNLGVLVLGDTELVASFAVRSSVESSKKFLEEKLLCLSDLLGGTVQIAGDYPGWEFKKESDLRSLISKVYEEQSGTAPTIEAIHAGLECGVFSGKIEGLDCISLGPNMYNVHTTAEALSISSVGRLWNLMVEVLKRSKS